MSYKKEFKQAEIDTKANGFIISNLGKIIPNEENIVKNLMLNFGKNINPNMVVGQCVRMSYLFLNELSRNGIQGVLTIGYIKTDFNDYFKKDISELINIRKNDRGNLDIHVWITLPSMDIVDLTFPTSYGKLNNIDEIIGGTIYGNPDQLTGGLEYHPILLGENYLRHINAIN